MTLQKSSSSTGKKLKNCLDEQSLLHKHNLHCALKLEHDIVVMGESHYALRREHEDGTEGYARFR
jgi:hypothetical protein